jgi:hypothetical protein
MRTEFADVCRKVLRQHEEIRARLHGLDHTAEAATTSSSSSKSPKESEAAWNHLRISLVRLASAFDAHLAYEEVALMPLLHELDAWGPEHEAAMRAEHLEQRKRLEEICAAAEDDPPMDGGQRALADEVRWLVTSLLEDMVGEEAELAKLDQTVDNTIEQFKMA